MDIRPTLYPKQALAAFRPPRHFAKVSFDTFFPAHETQERAQQLVRDFGEELLATSRWWKRRQAGALYLDGGFGVGKTHLLAALAFAVGEGCVFATFAEYTHLVGMLGFARTLRELSRYRLVCIDEFELDDVGDTLIVTRLVRELMDFGVSFVVTSNTLPQALGMGRFAAGDFQREIGSLAQRFQVLTLDGEDFRRRNNAVVTAGGIDVTGPQVAVDSFDALLAHLGSVHQGMYRELVRGLRASVWRGCHLVDDEYAALRLVVLVDRLYDEDVPVRLDISGELFTARMLGGGYRAKYLRALSRLSELTTAPISI